MGQQQFETEPKRGACGRDQCQLGNREQDTTHTSSFLVDRSAVQLPDRERWPAHAARGEQSKAEKHLAADRAVEAPPQDGERDLDVFRPDWRRQLLDFEGFRDTARQ
jgi:hypothetical protein